MNTLDVVEVTSPEQLAVLAGLRPFRPFLSMKRLSLQMPSVQGAPQDAAERRLNFWLGVCGCKPGGLLLLVALIWRIAGHSRTEAWTLEGVLVAAGWVVAAGVVGKLAALLIARVMVLATTASFLRGSAGIPEHGGVSHGL